LGEDGEVVLGGDELGGGFGAFAVEAGEGHHGVVAGDVGLDGDERVVRAQLARPLVELRPVLLLLAGQRQAVLDGGGVRVVEALADGELARPLVDVDAPQEDDVAVLEVGGVGVAALPEQDVAVGGAEERAQAVEADGLAHARVHADGEEQLRLRLVNRELLLPELRRLGRGAHLLGREVERARRGGGGVCAVDEAVDRRVAQDEQRRLRVADEQAPDGLVLLGAEGRRIDHGLALSQLAVTVVEREQREAEDDDDADEEEALRPFGDAGGRRFDRRVFVRRGGVRVAVRSLGRGRRGVDQLLRRVLRARVVEDGVVVAFGQVDDDHVGLTFARVILLELRPQPSGLHAHDRVDARVVVAVAPEDLGGDGVLFELRLLVVHRLLDDEAEERLEALRVLQRAAVEHLLQML
jgi:hypothetical protein